MPHIPESERRDLVLYLTTLQEFYDRTLQLVQSKKASDSDSEPRTLRKRLLQQCRVFHLQLQPRLTRPMKDGEEGLMPLTWRRMVLGAAEAAQAARAAAFQERVGLSIGEPRSVVGPVEGAMPFKLAINFPSHLLKKFSPVSAGTHGWMFAVDCDVANVFDRTTQLICTLVRVTDDGLETSLGTYKVHRWFEADMYGPEFYQLAEEDRKIIIWRLTNEIPGTDGFDVKERALLLSQNTISCLFLQYLPLGNTPRKPELRAFENHNPRSPSSGAQLLPHNHQDADPLVRVAIPPPQSQSLFQSSDLQTVSGQHGAEYSGPSNTPANSPSPSQSRAVQVYVPYIPPRRVTVPVLNVTPPTPQPHPPPLINSYPSSQHHLYPHYKPGNVAANRSTFEHSHGGNGVPAGAHMGLFTTPSQRHAGPPTYWDQNDPSVTVNVSAGQRVATGPYSNTYRAGYGYQGEQQYFYRT
ncbi:hypothetical protein DFH07DRAFT_795739 [Mycena maculata]|uniref:Uncharacterized protein n=1 Tax=Mycena maculata TaxID=230809 RepID=A0AAD7K5Q2_9AGAR|nr:hypothetical protein DFH07DRAFT_795739 [Mycena maculata]